MTGTGAACMGKYLPYLVLVGIALFALVAGGGEMIGALAITLAFAIGWLQATGRLFRRRDKNDKDTAE